MELNYYAVLVAAIVYVAIGFAWWAPGLFGKKWINLMGWGNKTKEEMDKMKKKAGPAYATTIFTALIMSTVFAYFMEVGGIGGDIARAIRLAVVLWVAFVASTSMVDYMYAQRPRGLWWINYGYHLVAMIVMAIILSAWQ